MAQIKSERKLLLELLEIAKNGKLVTKLTRGRCIDSLINQQLKDKLKGLIRQPYFVPMKERQGLFG